MHGNIMRLERATEVHKDSGIPAPNLRTLHIFVALEFLEDVSDHDGKQGTANFSCRCCAVISPHDVVYI